VAEGKGFRRFLLRGTPNQERRLEAYKQQAKARREVKALFSTHRPPPGKGLHAASTSGYPQSRQIQRNSGALGSERKTPDAGPSTYAHVEEAPDFDESMAGKLQRRYGSEVHGSTWWHA
jgi:hypothetical protein